MKLKVCYNNEIHRLSKSPDTLETLLELVNSIFHLELPESWTLQYTDTDGDNICLTSEKDYEEFMSSTQTSNSMTKVHVVPVTSLKQSIPVVEEVIVVENENREEEEYQVIQRQDQHDLIKPSEPVDLSEESFESNEDKPEESVQSEREKGHKSEEPMKSQVCIDMETLEKLVSSMVEKSLAKLTEVSQQLLEKPKNAVEFQNSMLLADDSFLSEVEKPKEAMKVKHVNVRCDGCGVMPIMGVRYKCQTCANYDLCEKCEDEGQHSHHNFIKMKKCDAHDAYAFGLFMPMRSKSIAVEEELEAPVEKKNYYVGEEEPCDDNQEEEEYEYQYEDDCEEQCEERNLEEPVPEAEEITYYDKLMDKVGKLLKVFPNAKFHMLAAFVNDAPDDLDMEELVENFKH